MESGTIMFVSHPLIRKDSIESRLYQEVIVGNATRGNTLVVAPTALGKTVIAVLLAAHRLKKFPTSKILMISTTRPLVSQHATSFKNFIKIDEDEINVFTGSNPPDKRATIWGESKIICATPQVIGNDLISGSYPLDDVSLVIFDEAHRTTGDYPYAFIAKQYMTAASARNPLILALTASPGADEERIREVCENLFIENIEVRTEDDPDVRPYVKGIKVEWKKVDLPDAFVKIKKHLETTLKDRLTTLKNMGLVNTINVNISKKDILLLRGTLQSEISKRGGAPELYIGVSMVTACINLTHAIELLETQGLDTLQKYFERLEKQGSKAAKGLLRDVDFMRALRLTENLSPDMEHPKLTALIEIVEKAPKDKRIMIFSQYRDSAQKIVDRLMGMEGVRPVRFVGQASKDRDKGLSQKQQLEILQKFRDGEYNVLVATSVAEEGLDIPKVDLVIFYEPIPSEIRTIQRRGRTGRSKAGRVVVLMTKKTRDEWFYWSGFRKEKRMRGVLQALKNSHYKPKIETTGAVQKGLKDFFEHKIVVDPRELSSTVVRELLELGIISKPKMLDVGDYILSDRVCVERKTADDFIQSILDKRLYDQILRLKRAYSRPVLIIEGHDLYSKRDIHPNAIRGALASLVVDFCMPIVFSRDEKDTAHLLTSMLKREVEENGGEVQIRGDKKAMALGEQQEFIVAGLPNVNRTIARRLLDEFKSVEGVFGATEEELLRVRGVGKKIAKEIRAVIKAAYSLK
jgi:ERCC4-related helicase